MFEKMFSPIKIRGLELKHRVVMPAMGTKFSGKDSYVTPQLIEYHRARVRGGSALNIVEVSSVHTPSAPRMFLSIGEDKYIPGLKQLTDVIHEEGGKAGIQLWQGSLAVGMDQTAQILMASDMPMGPGITLPGITVDQIYEIIDCYGKAAKRAVEAGFDTIEFHCAHNYLPHSFLSGGINHRTDEWGGSLENRMKFPLACIKAIRENIPEDMPLFMRVDAHDDYLPGGMTIEDTIVFCNAAKEAGVDVLDVSRGNVITPANKYEVPPIDLAPGFNIENAARIRKETGMITVGVGRINTPGLAEKYLSEDKVDMVVMGRAQLADPNFLNKAKAGNLEDIDYCVGCDQGCLDGFADVKCPHITCLRNPAVGKEVELALTPATQQETVLIAGAGIAGLEAAIVLQQRGHKAIVVEASDKVGGQFLTAGEAPRKAEMKAAVIAMGKKAERLGAEIRLNTPFTKEVLEEVKPHTVFNAIGAKPIIPNIPGADKDFVVNSHDVLNGVSKVNGNIVIIGGGMVGMEVAEYLAEQGCKVTDLEMMKTYCADMGMARKFCIDEAIQTLGINAITEVTVTAIEDGKVVGTKDGETVEYPCDYAVMAIGSRSNDGSAIEAACREVGCGYITIGDAGMARRALNAVAEAYNAARTFDDPAIYAKTSKPRKVIAVTGVTGTMGKETVKNLLSRPYQYHVKAFARPSEVNKQKMKEMADPNLEVIWGDLANYDDIKRLVDGSDYVLHIGAMVSPAADKYPEKTLYTNIGSTLSIIKAIKEQPDPDKVHFVYIGTVAETGARTYPIHWGRVGDPINPSIFDYYALSKVYSEMAVYDSGLKHWVSIRQTGQHPSAEGAGEEPIIFHQPVNNVLEWSTSIESGICMANICEDWVPESFWRKAYNLSSGPEYRLTCWELTGMMMEPFGLSIKDLYDADAMPLYNFHGHYYTDSKVLDDILHFRCIPGSYYWYGVKNEMERMAANPMIRAMFPTGEQMKYHNKEIGAKKGGYYYALENKDENWMNAFFGSKENRPDIKSWDDIKLFHPAGEETFLDHGYDETKGLENLTVEDLQKAAAFRGGKYLETEVPKDIYTPVKWQCHDGHEFMLSINCVLQGGHWCPECIAETWHYGDIAKKNPFYSQVWTPLHGEHDNYVIPMEFSGLKVANELKEKLGLK